MTQAKAKPKKAPTARGVGIYLWGYPPEEGEYLKRAAHARGMSMAEFVLALVRMHAELVKHRENWEELLKHDLGPIEIG